MKNIIVKRETENFIWLIVESCPNAEIKFDKRNRTIVSYCRAGLFSYKKKGFPLTLDEIKEVWNFLEYEKKGLL